MGEAIRTVVTGVAQGRSTVAYEGLTRPFTAAAMPGYAVVLESAIELELHGGEIVRPEQRKAPARNGTRHDWRPAAAGPCLVALAMIGAERR